MYVQMIPSYVGSGVEVRQTEPVFNGSTRKVVQIVIRTFSVLESEYPETVVLSSIGCDGKVKGHGRP